jgi:asparagine synthase (glutamine-hydrolysing)
MCGVCGFVGTVDQKSLHRMGRNVVHRGPDEEGFHLGKAIRLGVRRLSIIDVPGGHQPITNEDVSVVVAFNGENYNHR